MSDTALIEPNLIVDFKQDGLQLGLDIRLTNEDLDLPVDDLYRRILRPAFQKLLAKIAQRQGKASDGILRECDVIAAVARAEDG